MLFLFERNGLWGAVGRSRDPGLHGRKPRYKRLRDLRELDARGVSWRLSEGDDHWVIQEFLIEQPHKALRGSDSRYRKWAKRYRDFKAEHPEDKPVYYDNVDDWL